MDPSSVSTETSSANPLPAHSSANRVTDPPPPYEGELLTYGLREHVLSPIETLTQSISTIAPTTSPAITIPLVFALAGNGTWLVYLLATVGVLLVGLCISRFARYSASPGSLYQYATSTLPPPLAAVAAWALLLAYIATGSSVAGGFINYANLLLQPFIARPLPPVLLAAFVVAASIWIAYRDVKLSAQLMLWFEGASVSMIVIVLVILLSKHGLHFDPQQWSLKGSSVSGIRLGVVLALFSFVGFECATTLGNEARDPLRTIPRAVIQSAVLAGFFFIVSAYGEVLGFHGQAETLGQSNAPLHVLAASAGVRVFASLIDLGVVVSLFACTLACVTAAARVLLMMAKNGLVPARMARTHHRNETPHEAVIVAGLGTLLPTVTLAAMGIRGFDIYGWMGSLATYGFITVYGLICIALPIFLRRRGDLTPAMLLLAAAGTLAMLAALEGSLYPVPVAPYNWLPYVYLVYLAIGSGWHFVGSGTRSTEETG